MRILVAEDEKLARLMLEEMLRDWGHAVVSARDGAEAWELLRGDPDISVLISDWVMPAVDGLELCRRVRASQRPCYLPIILATARDQTEHLVEGLEAGADAFLVKPLVPAVLQAQLRVAERILELERRLASRLQHLEEANERIRRDLEAAAAVQRSHLPRQPPPLPTVDFAWVYEACHTLGGDMFNVFRLDEEHVGVYVLDVSGHGTSAALLSVSLSRVLVPSPQQGGILKRPISHEPWYDIVPPAEVAAELNRRFQLLEQSGRYCTFLYGVLDLRTRGFRYVSAGHPGPILVSDEPAVSHDRGGGVPIGILDDAHYTEESIQLAPGSQLVLYTDGVHDAINSEGERFGHARVLGILSERDPRYGAAGVEATVQALQKRLGEFADGQSPPDDITIVGMGIV